MKPVFYRHSSGGKRSRVEVEGVKACSECYLIIDVAGSLLPASLVASGRRVFVRRTMEYNKRRRVFLTEEPLTGPPGPI